MPLVPAPTPGNRLRDVLDGHSGQIRLSELQADYDGPEFERAVIQLVCEGEVWLKPVGEVVHVHRLE